MAGWHRRLVLGVIVLSGLVAGCGGPGQATPKPAPPATVAPIPESQLNRVVLTPEAEQRLGLEVKEVERRAVPRQRSFGGEVTVPPGALLTVAAPVSGTLAVPAKRPLPQVGSAVAEGQPMLTLMPHVLTQAEHVALAQATLQLAQFRIDAEGQVKQAKVQVEAANVNFLRQDRLLSEKVGVKKDFDDAVAQLQLAQKALEAALLRKAAVDGMQLDTDKGSVKPLEIKSPLKGIVKATHVMTGELVPAGAPLFEIMNVDTVWIKVPVYVGELADVAESKAALVRALGAAPGGHGVKAEPVPTPPTAQPQASAVDLYYKLANPDGKYRPGQRVSAQLTLRGEEKSLGLPWSAVVHDIYGGTWVYVQTKEHTYERRRVQVDYVVGDWAILAERAVLTQNPEAGTKVVTAGAAEVFGTEFGYSK